MRVRRSRKRICVFSVTFDKPEGATVAAAREYVEHAVRSYCGGLHPDDPLFGIDRATIRVRNLYGRPRKTVQLNE